MFTLFWTVGCSPGFKLSEFHDFKRFSSSGGIVRPQDVKPPIIFLPGIQGSVLTDDAGNIKWGSSDREARLRRFMDLTVEMENQGYRDDKDARLASWIEHYKRNNVREDRVLEKYLVGFSRKVRLITLPIYKEFRQDLVTIAGYQENADFFAMPYDWRLDNRIAAVKLGLMLDSWAAGYLAHVRKLTCGSSTLECDNYHAALNSLYNRGYLDDKQRVRFNIVAHSMGGLVSRYFVQVVDREDRINKLMVLGTPNRGSMKMLKSFAEGVEPNALFPDHESIENRPIIFSFPSAFQLLPRYGSLFLPEAVSFNTEQDLLLTQYTPEAISPAYLERVAENWRRYSLLPCSLQNEKHSPSCKAMPSDPVVLQALKDNLESSHKFILALNDPVHADWQYECGRMRASERFLRETNKFKSSFPTASITTSCALVADDRVQEAERAQKKLTMFGGFGAYTPVKAQVTAAAADRNARRLDFATDCDNCGDRLSLGDGTVPLQSIKFRQGEFIDDNGSFYMYETHVDLVKNDTFIYNVMRRLLDIE